MNIDAMLLLMQAGDPTVIDLDADVDSSDRYEHLFGLRNRLVADRTHEAFLTLLAALDKDFGEMPEPEDAARVQEIVYGVIANPRELDDLNESEVEVAHDVLVNVGVMRTLLYSYGVVPNEEDLMQWMARYHFYMVV